jgi:hypothetical protein
MSSLKGVWKMSSSLRSGAVATLPRHIRFEPATAHNSALEAGTVAIPFADHCGGLWEVHAVDKPSEGAGASALRAQFTVECASRAEASGSRLHFDGLYDGERIAGIVSADKAEVADFLCTRLYTFWGPPSPKAANSLD